MAALRHLLDTNIVSDLIRNPSGVVHDCIARVGEETVCVSIVVAAELRFGARKRNSAKLTGVEEGCVWRRFCRRWVGSDQTR